MTAEDRNESFDLSLDLDTGYEFLVHFEEEGVPELRMDEPPPLGEGHGPNASRLLAAAVGNCLSASALFCMRKARVSVRGMRTDVRAALERNEQGRLRVRELRVRIRPDVPAEEHDKMNRCLELFEDFCVVTQSVRRGIPVDVAVEPAGG